MEERILNKELLILGEVHGSHLNPIVANWLIKKFNISVVLLELETKWSKYLKEIHRPENLQRFVERIKKENWLVESGLIGKEHVCFIKQWIKNGKKIFGVKAEDKNWNRAEKLTAKNILDVLKKSSNKKALLIVGSLHARNSTFKTTINRSKCTLFPLGFLLRENSQSFCIRYNGGEFYNFGAKKMLDKHSIKAVNKSGFVLKKSRSRFFDYDIFVGHSKPITII